MYFLLLDPHPTNFKAVDSDPSGKSAYSTGSTVFLVEIISIYPFLTTTIFFNEIGLEFYCVPDIDD